MIIIFCSLNFGWVRYHFGKYFWGVCRKMIGILGVGLIVCDWNWSCCCCIFMNCRWFGLVGIWSFCWICCLKLNFGWDTCCVKRFLRLLFVNFLIFVVKFLVIIVIFRFFFGNLVLIIFFIFWFIREISHLCEFLFDLSYIGHLFKGLQGYFIWN